MKHRLPVVLALLASAACAPRFDPYVAPAGNPTAGLMSLESGTRLRLYGGGAVAAQGRLVEATRDSISIRTAQAVTWWRVAQLDSITEFVDRMPRGALAGGITMGIVSGLALGWFANGICDAADCDDAFRDGALGGAAMGFAIGSGVGAIIGAASSGWKRIYPVTDNR